MNASLLMPRRSPGTGSLSIIWGMLIALTLWLEQERKLDER